MEQHDRIAATTRKNAALTPAAHRSSPARRCGLPFREPARKAAAVAISAVPCRICRAVARHQQHHVKPPGSAQRIDRLAWRLCDRAGDIERRIDGYLDAGSRAPSDRRSEGIVFSPHDLDPPGAVGMNHCRVFARAGGFDCAERAIMRVGALAGENVVALQLFDRAPRLCSAGTLSVVCSRSRSLQPLRA